MWFFDIVTSSKYCEGYHYWSKILKYRQVIMDNFSSQRKEMKYRNTVNFPSRYRNTGQEKGPIPFWPPYYGRADDNLFNCGE